MTIGGDPAPDPSSAAQTTVQGPVLPDSQLEMPAQMPGYITVPRRDWQRVRACVDQLKVRLPMAATDATTWAIAFLGMAATAALALLPLFKGGQTPSGVTITIFIAAIVAFSGMGLVCLIFGRQGKGRRNQLIDDVTEAMDEIVRAHYGDKGTQLTAPGETTVSQVRVPEMFPDDAEVPQHAP